MSVPFDLRSELEKRDLGIAELAESAGLARGTVARLVKGESPGRPRTRRLLRAALAEFPPVEQVVDGVDASVAPEPVATQPPPRRSGAELLAEHLRTPKDPWGAKGAS